LEIIGFVKRFGSRRQALAAKAKFAFAGDKGRSMGLAVTDIAPDDVFRDDIIVPAKDRYVLAATLFLPRGPKRHAVLINSATATPRKIYRGFAAYLAQRGCAVLTYDYRGIGGSRQIDVVGYNRPKSLVGFKATMADWATLDVAAAVSWMRERYSTLPLLYVGHSFGGQALGLIANNGEVSRALLIAAQAAYWKLMAAPERYRVFVLLKFAGVPLARVLGYAPAWSGLGADMPKDAFLQWAHWVMSPRYLFDDDTLADVRNFATYKGEMRALCFADDPWATRAAVGRLCMEFSAIEPEIVSIRPRDVGLEKIGHFGFFRPEHRYRLWTDAADWLLRE
jgi:predicted alpha/beta hydrolase